MLTRCCPLDPHLNHSNLKIYNIIDLDDCVQSSIKFEHSIFFNLRATPSNHDIDDDHDEDGDGDVEYR